MDKIKPVTENRLRFLAADKKFDLNYLEKDYYLTVLLYFLREVPGLCFKGGTALNKIFLNHKRLSEDLDFTCTGPLDKKKLIAEKVRTLFQRKKARDYFDLYTIIQQKIPLDLKLVRKKLKDVNKKFEIKQIFKNANKVYRGWDKEISTLTNKPIEYKKAISAIAKKFKYKQSKK